MEQASLQNQECLALIAMAQGQCVIRVEKP